MLNEASKQGIIEILSTLDDNTIRALAATVTQGLLKNKIHSRNDAATAVLNYSPDALSFLRRKIITREVLLNYIHQKNIPVDLPATKNNLIERIAHFWNIQYTQEFADKTNTVDSGSVTLLAERFTQWFYTMLNKNEYLSSEHFYPDAKLTLNMSSHSQVISDVIENPQQIVQKLFMIRTNYNLFFNPNLSGSGVLGKVDPHGLVLVLVCGTLHKEGTCVGVFEQVFGLVRDPNSENNWKIKTSEMNLKSQNGVTSLPTLESSNLLTS